MMIAVNVIKFPVIGISTIDESNKHIFVASNESELNAVPLHDILQGYTKSVRIVDSNGLSYKACCSKIKGVYWRRFKDIGIITSFISCIFGGFNIPLVMDVKHRYIKKENFEEIKELVLDVVEKRPRYYTRFKGLNNVKKQIKCSKSFEQLALAIV